MIEHDDGRALTPHVLAAVMRMYPAGSDVAVNVDGVMRPVLTVGFDAQRQLVVLGMEPVPDDCA